MKNALQYCKDKLGISYLSNTFMRYLGMHGSYSIGFTLSSVFVSTFLFKIDGDFLTVGIYYALTYVFQFIGQLLSLSLLRKIRPSGLSCIGLALYTLSFLFLLLLQERSNQFLVLLAALAGLGGAAYWLPYHNYAKAYTSSENRQYGVSLSGMLMQLIGLVFPSLSGLIISAFSGNNGYIIIFAISTVLIFCGMLIARTLPSVPLGGEKNIFWKFVWNYVPRHKAVQAFWLGNLFTGACTGISGFYLNLLIFSMTSSESVIGFATSAKALAAALVYYIIRRYVSRRSKTIQIFLGAFIMTLATVVLFFWYDLSAVILYSIVFQTMFQLVENGSVFSMFDVMELMQAEGYDNNYTITSFRESGLNIGRTFGVLLYLLVPPSADSALWVMLFLCALNIPSAFCFYAVEKFSDQTLTGENALNSISK